MFIKVTPLKKGGNKQRINTLHIISYVATEDKANSVIICIDNMVDVYVESVEQIDQQIADIFNKNNCEILNLEPFIKQNA